MAKIVTMATWDDVPHLSEKAKAEMLADMAPYQRDARSKGRPQLGSGAIYPIPESEIIVQPFAIPAYWPRAYGLDVGWNFTAAIFGAHDRETDTLYLYDEWYREKAEPSVHAEGMRRRGEWLNGVIDPAARGRGQKDGEQLLQAYRDLGLNLTIAKNGVEAGLFEVYGRMTTGRLKIFSTLQHTIGEYRLYRRDKKGHVVKVKDHAMDAARYLVVSGIAVATTAPNYLDTMTGQSSRMKSDFDPYADA